MTKIEKTPEEQAREALMGAPKTLPRVSTFDGMPKYLKDPKNYEKIMKLLYEAGNSRCSHSEIFEFSMCKKCEQSRINRVLTMRKLGFRDGQQYISWRRVHENLRTYHREELEKYNSK